MSPITVDLYHRWFHYYWPLPEMIPLLLTSTRDDSLRCWPLYGEWFSIRFYCHQRWLASVAADLARDDFLSLLTLNKKWFSISCDLLQKAVSHRCWTLLVLTSTRDHFPSLFNSASCDLYHEWFPITVEFYCSDLSQRWLPIPFEFYRLWPLSEMGSRQFWTLPAVTSTIQ
jgi:hypothetical protein